MSAAGLLCASGRGMSRRMNRALAVLAVFTSLVACTTNTRAPRADAGPVDLGATVDLSTTPDAGPAPEGDLGGLDAARADTGASDAGAPVDAAPVDAALRDAASAEAAVLDAGPGCTPRDAGSVTDAGASTGDTCGAAIELPLGATLGGSTLAPARDDYGPGLGTPGCAAGGSISGNDVVYVLRSPTAVSVRVTVTPMGASYDPMLYALLECVPLTQCLAATILNGPGQPESIDVDVPACVPVFVVVDGETVTNGRFDITAVAL